MLAFQGEGRLEMGKRLLELFMRGSHRSAMVDPRLFQEVLLVNQQSLPSLPCARARRGECCARWFRQFAPIAS